MDRNTLVAFILAASAFAAPTAAATLHVDEFQTPPSTLGWVGGSSPTYVATGGPSGEGDGYLRISALNTNFAAYNESPEWIGSYESIDARYVTVDLMSPTTSAPLEMRLVLFGPGSTFDRWTSATAHAIPNDGVWRTYAFSMAAGDLTRVLGSGTHQQLMDSVVRVMLRHDPGTPSSTGTAVPSPGGVLNIDNVRLAESLPAQPGDFNGDGAVDWADLNDAAQGWKARFGSDLDGGDFLIWQRNFSPPVANRSVQPAPEPSSSRIASALAGLAFAWRRPRRLPASRSVAV